ncbi:MAG: hypothetical protein LBF44_03390 [Holosporaceae bacterium]|jgi:hypothetical protein|nr:hypothetical protein [Holosporaceae bacterium]
MKIKWLLLVIVLFLRESTSVMCMDLTRDQSMIIHSLCVFMQEKYEFLQQKIEECNRKLQTGSYSEKASLYISKEIQGRHREIAELGEHDQRLQNVNSDNFIKTVESFREPTLYFSRVMGHNNLELLSAWMQSGISINWPHIARVFINEKQFDSLEYVLQNRIEPGNRSLLKELFYSTELSPAEVAQYVEMVTRYEGLNTLSLYEGIEIFSPEGEYIGATSFVGTMLDNMNHLVNKSANAPYECEEERFYLPHFIAIRDALVSNGAKTLQELFGSSPIQIDGDSMALKEEWDLPYKLNEFIAEELFSRM